LKQGKRSPEQRDKQELERAVQALQATSPSNPGIEWAPVIRLVAPIVARIAARYVMGLLSRKLNRRISSKIREETVQAAADRLAEIVIKRTSKPRK